MRASTRIITSTAVVAAALLSLKLTVFTSPAGVHAEEPPDELRLTGGLRDFKSTHPDFGSIPTAAVGHTVRNVDATIPLHRRPVYLASGLKVTDQWYDKHSNPIMPYIPDDGGGLPGGHFDVDVFDEATDKQLYHEHEFDDKFDVGYVDVVNDPNLLYASIVGPAYPNDLRVEFLNPHHGSGTYVFQAGGPVLTGNARDGFTTTFSPAQLTQLRVTFAWLLELRGTSPGDVQNDVADRDDGFAIRMYDMTTNALVYELAVYHHGDEGSLTLPSTSSGTDSCGVSTSDEIGDFGGFTTGAVTSAATFDQWFRDVLGTNLSKAHSITLKRDPFGVYEYLDDNFHPADRDLLGNEGQPHNDLFTYALNGQFTHQACKDWFFEFQGNDAAWVYIDRKLVIDIGGAAAPSKQYISLDRLGLEEGKTYTFDFYYAHRRTTPSSIFRMRTNVPLATPNGFTPSMQFD